MKKAMIFAAVLFAAKLSALEVAPGYQQILGPAQTGMAELNFKSTDTGLGFMGSYGHSAGAGYVNTGAMATFYDNSAKPFRVGLDYHETYSTMMLGPTYKMPVHNFDVTIELLGGIGEATSYYQNAGAESQNHGFAGQGRLVVGQSIGLFVWGATLGFLYGDVPAPTASFDKTGNSAYTVTGCTLGVRVGASF